MQMTTLKANRYGNRQNLPGDVIEVRSDRVRLLRALGWAKETPKSPAEPDGPPQPEVSTVTAAKPKRAYRRRDMTAEA